MNKEGVNIPFKKLLCMILMYLEIWIDFYKNIKVHKDMEYLNKSMIVEGHKKSVCPFKKK